MANFDAYYATGKITKLATNFPAKLRHAADKAKLISANDGSGFTYRGRFNDTQGSQACGIGYEVSQKAHNALRWLIARQGYKDGGLAIVAWSLNGKSIPDPLTDAFQLFGDVSTSTPVDTASGYVAQDFALRLRQKMRGYASELGNATGIVVLALDAATPGRMALLYYRELAPSEFLDKLELWHQQCCWQQAYSYKIRFIGAPAPRDIAETAYGQELPDSLRTATVRQLLTCILDAAPIPTQLLQSCFKRVCNRAGFKKKQNNSKDTTCWDWEKALGITCALYRKHYFNIKDYQMSLERELTSRDYLYGRLLALAEHLEGVALQLSGETRPTNAARLMQQFADKPCATWRTLELQLHPYKQRLKTSRAGFLYNVESEIDSVMAQFNLEDFSSPAKLSGEFLLGYHCQRAALRQKTQSAESKEGSETYQDINS